jgi:hypothetical protein
LAKVPSSPPPFESEQRGGGAGMAGRQGRPPAAPATATAGDKGKRKRGARGSYSRAHLGLSCTVEAAPRESSGAAAALGGEGAVVLGEEGRRCCETVVVWCGEPGRPSAPFIGGGWRLGEEIFLRRASLRRARGASRGGDRRRDGSAGTGQLVLGVRPWTRPGVQARGRLRSAGGGDGSGRGGVNGAGRVGWLRRPARRGPAVA